MSVNRSGVKPSDSENAVISFSRTVSSDSSASLRAIASRLPTRAARAWLTASQASRMVWSRKRGW